MRAKTWASGTVQWLSLISFVGFVAVSIVETGATAASKIPAMAAVPPDESTHAAQPIVIASLGMTPAAPSMAVTPIATPHVSAKDGVQFASIDPAAKSGGFEHGSREPFGHSSLRAPDSIVWVKWRRVTADIDAEEPNLMRCLADESTCSPAAARFAAIVKEARGHEGHVRLNFVNQRVNNAIRYTSDMTQWGVTDQWSAPLAAGKGSFETGLGDCEDYAIAKYVALRAAGMPANQLRVLLVRDNISALEHAVLSANVDGHWYILDNRWTAAVEDKDVRRFTLLFTLDDQGVKLPIARDIALKETLEREGHKLPSVLETTDQKQPEQSGISALGLRPSIS